MDSNINTLCNIQRPDTNPRSNLANNNNISTITPSDPRGNRVTTEANASHNISTMGGQSEWQDRSLQTTTKSTCLQSRIVKDRPKKNDKLITENNATTDEGMTLFNIQRASSELYQGEYAEFQNSLSEGNELEAEDKKVTDALLNILISSSKRVKSTLAKTSRDPSDRSLSKKELDEIIKRNVEEAEGYLGLKTNGNDLKAYVLKCTTLSYHMLINELPLLFETKSVEGENIDKNLYTAYRPFQSSVLDYIVWPPIIITSLDGSLLSVLNKGVANSTTTIMPHDAVHRDTSDETKEHSEHENNQQESDKFLTTKNNATTDLHQASAEIDKENIFRSIKDEYISVAKDEIRKLNEAEKEKKAAKDRIRAQAEKDGNKEKVILETKANLNKSPVEMDVFSGNAEKVLAKTKKYFFRIETLLETPEHYDKFYSFVRTYNDLGREINLNPSSRVIVNAKIGELNDRCRDLLSEFAGKKLSDNNPNITNLADPNRPMKLANVFNCIYDQDWLSLMDQFEEKFEEKHEKHEKSKKYEKSSLWEIESIQFIQYIRVHVENHFNLWHDVVTDIVGSKEFIHMVEYSEDTYELTDNITPINKLHRIFVNNDALKSVFHARPSKLSSMYKDEEYKKVANKFCEALNKTFAFMMLQSPPCHIVFAEKDSKIDDMNKLYTKSGTHVNYVVWPALLIHENGALLNKGVVQPHDS